MKQSILFAAVSLLPLVAGSSHAASLALYEYTGGSLAPTSSAAGVTAGDVNFTGSTAFQSVIGGSFADVLVLNKGPGADTLPLAVANDSFYQFTLALDPGASVDLSSLTLETTSLWSTPAGSDWAVRSSLDGFTADLATKTHTSFFPAFETTSVDLSAPEFQGLTAPVTFRIYVADDQSNPSQAVDSMILEGEVRVIPEPSVGMLLAAAMAALARRRRTPGLEASGRA